MNQAKRHIVLCFFYFSECADTVQFRTAGSRKKCLGSFFQQSDSNPGQLGTKRERYRCAMPSPLVLINGINAKA